MAVRSKVKAPKVQKQRKPRSVAKTFDEKHFGPEPIDVSARGYVNSLNWYNYMFDNDQARTWLLEFMKKNEYSRDHIAAVRRYPKDQVITTIGWQARMMMNGNTLDENSMSFFKRRVSEIITIEEPTKSIEQVVERAPVSIRERTEAKIRQLLTECEEAIDNDPALNVYDWLKGKEASPQAATTIRDYYAKWIDDFSYIDEHATRAEKKHSGEKLKYWTQFVDDCERYIGNKKVTKVRKPREKKQKSAVDLVKNLQFQKEFPPLKIVSIHPADIIGAQQLWTYNTKYKKLTRYDASGPGGIQVKGTTIIGFDVERSFTKSLRKPDVTIQQLLGAGKVALRKFMEEIKTTPVAAKGRINTDVILLRVIK